MRLGVRRAGFWATAVGLALLTGGCTVGPNYEKPEVRVEPNWKEAEQRGVDTASAEMKRWWTSFNDPLLDSLVGRAIQSNLDLKVAEARIREARASAAVVAAGAWPTLNSSGSYSRSRSSENASPRTGSRNGGGGSTSGNDLFRTGFDSSWEVDVFGKVRRSVEAAEATVEASVEDRRDVLVTLLGEVANNYINLRGFQRRLGVARENLKAQEDNLDLTRVRFEAGLASDLDVAQAEVQVNATAASIPTLESSVKQSAYALDVLLGLQPGALWGELEKETVIPRLPPEVLVGLPSELLRRRPDIRSAERRLAAATAQIGVATADLFPSFTLTGAYGFSSINAGNLLTHGSQLWSIGPAIRWPVFDAGKIRATIDVRNAQQEQALETYKKTVLTALREVETSLVNYSKEQSRYRSLTDAVAANRRAVRLANELYRQGLTDFLNVVVTQRSLYTAESDMAQSEATMATNLVSLYKALGGGW